MEFRIEVLKDYMLIETSGEPRGDDFTLLNEAIAAHPERDPDRPIVIDHSGLAQAQIPARDLPPIAETTSRRFPEWRAPRVFICPDRIGYGNARIWRAHLDPARQALVGIVGSREEAVAWLKDYRASQS